MCDALGVLMLLLLLLLGPPPGSWGIADDVAATGFADLRSRIARGASLVSSCAVLLVVVALLLLSAVLCSAVLSLSAEGSSVAFMCISSSS